MTPIFLKISIYIASELIAFLVFRPMRKFFTKRKFDKKPVLYGIFERMFLYVSLLHGVGHALVFFGALKVGTRIKADDKISNDYFLIGNLFSVGIVIVTILIMNYIS